MLKQFILSAGQATSGLGAFGAARKPATAATSEGTGETDPLMPSNENTGGLTGMLELLKRTNFKSSYK